jgi:riboflavin kinase / FMN adenylyltransferase
MIIIDSVESYVRKGRPVVTLGNFDGVHLGHTAIFKTMKGISEATGEHTVAVTFRRHPRNLLYPEIKIPFLTSLEEKLEYIAHTGIDMCVVIDFTLETAHLHASDFIRSIVSGTLDASHVVIGYDHAFGKNREGTMDSLVSFGSMHGFGVTRLEPMMSGDVPVSSSRIRSMLDDGDVKGASLCLGRSYAVRGSVIKGASRGRTLGFPTANLLPHNSEKCIPATGVYASRVQLRDGRLFNGVTSIGTNPTFGGTERSIETYIFDFNEDLYDESISVHFVARIRGEITFSDAASLIECMKHDCEKAKELLHE